MAVTLTLTSLVTNDRIVANFSDITLPKYARMGEIYVVNGVLYVYADLDGTGVGRWFPLTNRKLAYTFDQTEELFDWHIPYNFSIPPTPNLEVIVYNQFEEVVPFDYTVNVNEGSIDLNFKTPTSGRAYLVDDHRDSFELLEEIHIGSKNLVVAKDPNNANQYYVEIHGTNINVEKNGNTSLSGSLVIGGTVSINDDVVVQGNLQVHGSTNIDGNLTIKGTNVNIQTNTLNVSDNIITINKGYIGSPVSNVGLEVDRGTEGILPLITFDEQNDMVVIPVKNGLHFIQDEVAGKKFVEGLVNLETNRAIASETALKSFIDIEKNRIDNILNLSTADADNFKEIVDLIKSVDTTNDAVFAGYVSSNNEWNTTLSNNLNSEINRAKTVEGSLGDLNTTNKNNLVSSINELQSSLLSTKTLLTTKIEFEENRATVAETNLNNRISNEISVRESDVNNLKTDLNTEVSRATAYEQFLLNKINNETLARESVLDGTSTSLVNEIDRAKQAENSLQLAIDSEKETRENSILTLSSHLNQEITRSTNFDNSLQTQLDNEKSKRETDITVLTNNLASEVIRSTNEEVLLKNQIDLEILDRTNAVSTINANLDSQSNRISAVNTSLQNLISEEKTLRIADVTKLTDDLLYEVNRSTGVETSLQQSIALEKSIRENNVSTLNTNITSEINRATLAETTIQTNLTKEKTDRESAINVVTQSLTSEVNRAMASEASLNTLINDEKLTRVNAVTVLTNKIDSEINRATTSESSLQSAITKEKNDRESAISAVIQSLTSEVTRATTTETSLQSTLVAERNTRESAINSLIASINTEKSRVDSILMSSSADKDSFAEIVTLINSVSTDSSSSFAGYVTSNNAVISNILDGTTPVSKANSLTKPVTISLAGDVVGEVIFNGSANVTLNTVVGDSSHSHSIATVNGLQAALDGKQPFNVSTVIDSVYVHTDNNYTTADKNKLSGIQTGAQVNTITSVAGRVGDVVLNIGDISITSTVTPSTSAMYDLGTSTKKFKDLYIGNGIYIGNYLITVDSTSGVLSTTNTTLPPGSPKPNILMSSDVGVTVQAHNSELDNFGTFNDFISGLNGL